MPGHKRLVLPFWRAWRPHQTIGDAFLMVYEPDRRGLAGVEVRDLAKHNEELDDDGRLDIASPSTRAVNLADDSVFSEPVFSARGRASHRPEDRCTRRSTSR